MWLSACSLCGLFPLALRVFVEVISLLLHVRYVIMIVLFLQSVRCVRQTKGCWCPVGTLENSAYNTKKENKEVT
jgi:hypothetical protein